MMLKKITPHNARLAIFAVTLLALIAVVGYLGTINHSSAVQIGATTSKITFRLTSPVTLFEGWGLTSVQFENTSFAFQPLALVEGKKVLESYSKDNWIKIAPTWKGTPNNILFRTVNSYEHISFGGIQLPAGAIVTIDTEENDSTVLILRVEKPDTLGALRPTVFTLKSTFSIEGDDLSKVDGSMMDIANEQGSVFDARLCVVYAEHGINFLIRFTTNLQDLLESDFKRMSFAADSIKFDERLVTNRISQGHSETDSLDDPFIASYLTHADVKIAAEDLFNKPFVMKEFSLKRGDFLAPNKNDKYSLQIAGMKKGDLLINLYSNNATDLQSGGWSKFVDSDFPSTLDFIIEEPGKKAIWSILILLSSGYAASRSLDFLRKSSDATTEKKRIIVRTIERRRKR